MKLLILFSIFFKLGFFTFGGGYAMIPMMQKELIPTGLLTDNEFADLLSVSQVMPGALGINVASYVGFKVSGFWGLIISSFGVFLPSLIIIIIVAGFFKQYKETKYIKIVLDGIRPATIGLILGAVVFFLEMSVLGVKVTQITQKINFSFGALIIFIISFVLVKKININPILMLIFSAIMGMIIL